MLLNLYITSNRHSIRVLRVEPIKYEPTHTNVLESRASRSIARRRVRRRRRARSTSASASRAITTFASHRASPTVLTHAASTSARRHSSRDGSTPSRGASPCFRLDARETARERAIPRVVNARWTRRRVAAFGTSARAIGRRGEGDEDGEREGGDRAGRRRRGDRRRGL